MITPISRVYPEKVYLIQIPFPSSDPTVASFSPFSLRQEIRLPSTQKTEAVRIGSFLSRILTIPTYVKLCV